MGPFFQIFFHKSPASCIYEFTLEYTGQVYNSKFWCSWEQRVSVVTSRRQLQWTGVDELRSSSAASKRSDVFISSHFLFIHRPGSDCLISNPRQLDARNKPELEPAEENQTLVRDIRWVSLRSSRRSMHPSSDPISHRLLTVCCQLIARVLPSGRCALVH